MDFTITRSVSDERIYEIYIRNYEAQKPKEKRESIYSHCAVVGATMLVSVVSAAMKTRVPLRTSVTTYTVAPCWSTATGVAPGKKTEGPLTVMPGGH